MPSTDDLPFELSSLANAVNYQQWVSRLVKPYVGQRVLEIGAGIGSMSRWLPERERLILTETDPALLQGLTQSMNEAVNRPNSKTLVRKLDLVQDDLAWLRAENIDTIISFNVLEHVEDDHSCLTRLADLLRDSKTSGPKRLVTFVPAHGWAYGEMDRTFGHFRRYSKRATQKLCAEVAPEAKLTIRHFNLVGLLGWIVNGRILKKKMIGTGSIKTFEKICPWIAPFDEFLHNTLRLPIGQSILIVLEWD